jgi:hypothetical protein
VFRWSFDCFELASIEKTKNHKKKQKDRRNILKVDTNVDCPLNVASLSYFLIFCDSEIVLDLHKGQPSMNLLIRNRWG